MELSETWVNQSLKWRSRPLSPKHNPRTNTKIQNLRSQVFWLDRMLAMSWLCDPPSHSNFSLAFRAHDGRDDNSHQGACSPKNGMLALLNGVLGRVNDYTRRTLRQNCKASISTGERNWQQEWIGRFLRYHGTCFRRHNFSIQLLWIKLVAVDTKTEKLADRSLHCLKRRHSFSLFKLANTIKAWSY